MTECGFLEMTASVKRDFGRLLVLATQKATLPLHWLALWWSIVDLYTTRELTRRDDRWAAISGLAHMVQQVSGLTLLAGLWKKS